MQQAKSFAKANSRPDTFSAVVKSKALSDPRNDALREAVRRVIEQHFGKPPRGAQGRAAKAFGVSGGYLSDFLSSNRGAGPELLHGVARYRPLDVLRALEIDPKTIRALWVDSDEADAVAVADIPEALKRATRAAVELLSCTADEAVKAARAALEETLHPEEADADWWLLQLRERLPRRKPSGVRRRVK